MSRKPKLIVICGPTATGKSSLAVKIAKKVNDLNRSQRAVGRTSPGEVLGEIISADSRQVYKGLDIGSGKITKKEMTSVPHYLLNIVSPKRQFSVAEFQKLGQKAISDILKRGKTPIIVGGTGLYIDALVYDTKFPEVEPNKKLRKMLERKSAPALFRMLKKLDPDRAFSIDRYNSVRLIRAIEIAKALGKVPVIRKQTKYDVLWIGLTASPEKLKSNIEKRLLSRMKQGLVKEVQNLHRNGLSWKRLNELGLEYRFVSQYLQKKLSKQAMLKELETAINQYARRQMTWFKTNRNIKWFDINTKPRKKIESLIKKSVNLSS